MRIISRLLPIILALFTVGRLSAQSCISTGVNGTVINLPCGVNCTPMNFKVPHLKSTSDYNIVSIPYNPFPYITSTGTELTTLYQDDVYGPLTTLPFPFCFYDSLYTQAVVGSNGLVTFDATQANTVNSYTVNFPIPYAGGTPNSTLTSYIPRASILGIYSDLWPTNANSPADKKIESRVEGTAPCRRFVVSYYHIGVFGSTVCSNPNPTTFQIVMYESTGLIEVYILKKKCFPTTGLPAGNAILGVQNWQRNKAVAAPGKNATHWEEDSTGYRFIPSGPVSRFVKAELLTLSGTILATTGITAGADTATTTPGLLDLNFPQQCLPVPSVQYIVKTYFASCADPTTQMISSDTITVNKTTSLNATANPTPSACGPNGSITVNIPTGVGTAPYTLVLDGGAPVSTTNQTYTFTGLLGGSHTVVISTSDGCLQTIQVTVPISGILTVTHTVTPPTCNGANNGSVTINPQNGVAPFQYNINGGPNQASNIFTNLAPGTYNIQVYDASGCSLTTYSVTIPTGPLLLSTVVPTTTSCNGASNGSFTITPTTGTGPYTFTLYSTTPTFQLIGTQTSNVFSPLAVNSYIYSFTDAQGCTSGNINAVIVAGNGLTATATATGTSCAGANNGSITIIPTSGSGPYSYSIDGGTVFLPGTTINNLAPGTYSIILKDGAGCVSSAISVTVAQGSALLATATATATSCSGVNNGTITVTPGNGAGPYTYSLDGGAPQNNGTFANVSAGSHSVVVTDAAGCVSAAIPVTVSVGPAITGTAAATPTSCLGATNGTVTASAITGVAPYTYSLDGGAFQSAALFSNVAAGAHTIIIKDAVGCVTATINVTVAAGAALTATTATTPTSCNGVSNGSITVTPTNGSGTFSYSLDGGPSQGSNLFNNVSAGNHTIVVTSSLGCSSNAIPVSIAVGPAITGTTTTGATSCNGASDGTIIVTPTNGAGPYQYAIDGGAYQNSNSFANVTAGSHTILIKDAVGCTSAAINVTVATGSTIAGTATAVATSCSGVSNGTITVTNTGTIAGATYSLDGGAFQSGNVFSNVAAGSHTIIIQSSSGCISAAIPVTIAVGPPLTAAFTTTSTGCSGATNGSITLTPNNGAAPHQYSLNGGVFQAGNTFTNLAANTYSIVVKDAAGCTSAPFNVTVSPGQPLSATTNISNVLCNGGTTGSVGLTLVGNGTAPYQFTLDGGTAQTTNNPSYTFSNLGAGNHSVYFIDNNGCSNTQTFTVTEPSALSPTFSKTDVLCNGQNNGTISLSASGGTQPYQYSLTAAGPFQSAPGFNVAAGTFTGYVKDANGCVQTVPNIVVGQPAVLSGTAVPASANCTTNGTITIAGSGGSAPYQYSIDGVSYGSSGSISAPSGTYTAYVKDANNCVFSIPNITVGLSNNLTLAPLSVAPICEGTKVKLQPVTNATQFAWTVVSGSGGLSATNIQSPDASPTSTTIYGLTVTLGVCTDYKTVTVNVNPAPIPDAGLNDTICYGQDYVSLQGSGGLSYSWSPTTYLSDPLIANPTVRQPQATITYSLDVTDANNCHSLQSSIVRINVTPPIQVTISKDTIVALNDSLQLHASSIATNYLWSPATNLTDATNPNPWCAGGK
jgi:hypothetical protein